jgi:hypothetical protein
MVNITVVEADIILEQFHSFEQGVNVSLNASLTVLRGKTFITFSAPESRQIEFPESGFSLSAGISY